MRGIDVLRDELLGLSGVASAEVRGGAAGTPSTVTVRLRSGADARSVGVHVQRVLASHGLRSRVTEDGVVATSELPGAVDVPGDDAAGSGIGTLSAVIVEETGDGATVTVTASHGRAESAPAEPTEDGIARAVVTAVGRLVTGSPGRLVWMSSDAAGSDRVVTLVIERSDGARSAGAAIVRGGLAHAVARAAWEAITAGR